MISGALKFEGSRRTTAKKVKTSLSIFNTEEACLLQVAASSCCLLCLLLSGNITHLQLVFVSCIDTCNLYTDSGGLVNIRKISGLNSYIGATKNGLTSKSYGRWESSFVFDGLYRIVFMILQHETFFHE